MRITEASYCAEFNRNPPEGFSVGLVDDDNVFEWQLMILGPPDTLYEVSVLGEERGCFPLILVAPADLT